MAGRVVFVTSVFDEAITGPAIYAQYLWNASRDDSEIEFHVVAPSVKESHPHLHSSGVGRNSVDTYRRVQRLARRVAEDAAGKCIVHGNAAHSMGEFLKYGGLWLVQVNDYVASEVWDRPVRILLTKGVRRFISLAWRRWQEKRVVSAATSVICNSEFTRQRILQQYVPRSADRLFTIYKAVDAKNFERGARLADPYPDRPVGARVVFLGTDWRIKGLPDLLRAIKILSKTYPNTRLIVGGPSDEGNTQQIKKLISRHQLDEYVHVAGKIKRENLPALYQHSDVFVLPSHKEAFGVAILEAMAAGLPVIASDAGGIPEIVSDGVNGLTYPSGNAEHLACCLGRVIGDSSLRRDLTQNGFETAERFEVHEMVDSIRRLYKQIFVGVDEGQS